MEPWHDEAEPFPAYLRTLSAVELMVMRHDAVGCGDEATKQACDVEFKRREQRTEPTPEKQGTA